MEYSRLSLINEVFDIVDGVIEDVKKSGRDVEDWAFEMVKEMVPGRPESKSSEIGA